MDSRARSSRRRGVAILCLNLDPSGGLATGGMERQAVALAERLARLGRRVVAITNVSSEGDSLRFRLPFVERRRGVLYYRVPFAQGWSWETRRALYETLAAWVLRRHPEVSALYAVQAWTAGAHAARVGPRLGLPALVKLACSGRSGDLAVALEQADAVSVIDALRSVAGVAHLNDESRVEALAAGVDPERLFFVPNGIDLARFADAGAVAALPELGARELGEPEREVVLFVGRLGRQKRVGVLLEAFAQLATRRPRARLVLAGDGPERPALLARARELAIAERVSFLGVRSDIPELLRAARVFALPSAEEGQSNALLEALAARVPAVATDIAGNRALVTHEVEALLVPVDDPASLASALERLLVDRELAARLAGAGRSRVEAEFELGRVAARTLALLDELPRRPRPSDARALVTELPRDLATLATLFARESSQLLRARLTSLVVGLKRVAGA